MKKVSNNLVIMVVCGLALIFLSMLSADLVHSEPIYRFVDMPTDATIFFTDFDPRTFQSNLTANNITALSPTGNGISNFAATNYNNTIAPFGDDLYQGANTFTFQEPVFAVGLTFFATNYPTTDAPYSFDNNVPDVSHQVRAYDFSGNLIKIVFSSSWSTRTGPRSFHIGGGPSFVSSYAGIWTDVPIYEVSFGGIRPSDGALVAAYGSFAFSKTPNPISEPPTPALVGYWNFDEDSEDTAYDSSAYSNDGAIEGATPAVGKCGNAALSFDGGSDGGVDYVVVPNSDSINTSTFTVSFWVSISDLDETMIFLHKRNEQWGRNFQVSYNTVGPNGEEKDYLKVKIDNGTSSGDFDNAAYAEVNLESGKFYYVAATYDQFYLRLFLNGSPIAQIAEFPINMTDNVGDGDLYIGTHSAQHITMNPTNGIIDEVRIYNYALTWEEIQDDMEACVPEASVCSSTVTTIRDLMIEVEALETSGRTINVLNNTLNNVQRALDKGKNKIARIRMTAFIAKVVNRSNLKESNHHRIALDQANSLLCGAANVLIGVELP